MKYFKAGMIVFAFALFWCGGVHAGDRWVAAVKFGKMEPALDDWRSFYRDDRVSEYEVRAAYQLFPWLETGISAGYLSERGRGLLATSNTPGGRVVYELYPLSVNAQVLFRFSPRQWLVPYVGGGVDRVFYRLSVQDQEQREGGVSGSHWRAGMRVLLDRLDPVAFDSLNRDYGIDHAYLVMEVQSREARAGGGQDLGGDAYQLGIVLQF